MNDNPDVSIYMTTYYHEKYVAKAIESVLSQKVNFSYEIIISDDCSKDETKKIIKEYEKKYSFIKVNINNNNIGLTKNVFLARTLCKGKYITELSGDDYWIDNSKLQKQYDFLEKNNHYFAVGCRLKMTKNGKEIVIPRIDETEKEFTLEMFLSGKNYSLNGIMMRNPFLEKKGYNHFSIMPKLSEYIDDLTDSILILQYGRVYTKSDIFCVYRYRTDESNYNSINKGLDSYYKHIELLNNIEDYFDGEINLINRYAMINLSGLKTAIFTHRIIEYVNIYKKIPKKYRNIKLMFSSIILFIKRVLIIF